MNLTSDFLGNTKILTLLFQAAQGLAVAWRGFKTSSISNTFDLSMLRVFFPKIVKRMLEKSDLIFKTKAQNWNIAIDSAEVEECLECIGVLLYYIESLQKEGLKYFASLHLAKSQLLFIQESNTSLIISCLDGLDDYIDVRLCGLAYNFAASLANRGLNAEAVQFFGRCRSYYTICVQDLPLLVSKLIKPVQGECQCLIALKKYSDCVELISNVMGNLKVDQWLAPNNFKHLQSLVLMSVIAKSKNGNSNFRSISSGFGEWSLEIFEVELKFVLQQGLVDHRFQLLKEASIKAVPPLKKASFLLKLAELDRPHGKSYCQQAMGLIAGLDQDDPLVQSQRAIVLCETSISNNETGNADLLNGLQTWQNLFGHISPYRVELKPQNELKELDCNYLFHYLKQLAEYLRAIADFQMCTFAYGLASRLCNLCPELNQAEESLEIYVALAFAYIELGYSGRAGLSLGIAKSFLSSANSKLAANFYVAYSEYLLSIGNTQKSSEIRARVSIGADIDTLTFLFDSKLSLMCGDIKSSTDSAYTAYQKAMKLLKTSKHHNFAETAIIAEALKALLVLINLLDFQGFPKKIDYYIEQGLKLAEKMNSFVWHGLFSIEKARLHCKRAETNQSRNVISSALKDFESNDELTMFSGKLHLTHGDILLKDSTSAEFAKSEYISAETIVDTGLDPAFFNSFDIGKIQETLLSFTENAMAGKENIDRCDGLENVKGSILCSSSVLNLKAGNFKEAERKLTIVAKLRLSPKEKCLYYLNLSLLRYDQLMKSSASMDKAEVFPDAVLGYPFHSEPLLKRKFCSAAQLNNFKKFGAFLEDAFALLVEHGNPADAQVLSRIIVSIDTFKSFIMQAHSGEELDSCIYHLEYPKSIYHRRKNPQSTLKVETQTEWISRMNSQVWDRLPLDIVVCCINCDPERDILYITRHENGRTFHFKLPVCRLAQREAELNGKGMAFVDAMNEFEDIMVINKETTSSAKYCVEKEERKKWKKTREDLDDRLEKFLNRLESEWLAGFKVQNY